MADVTLPSLGESVTEGIIIQWFKKVGDAVGRDEALCEVSTDKVDSELPSPFAGVLTEILVEEGDTVTVGQRLAVIGDGDGAPAPGAATPDATAEPAPSATAPPASTPVAPPPSTSAAGASGAITSPFARQVLERAGVDPRGVAGTGPGGRVTRGDAEFAALGGAPSEGSGPALSAPMVGGPVGFVAVEAHYDAVERALGSSVAKAAVADGVPLDPFVFAVRAAVEALAEFPELNAAFDGAELVEHADRNIGVGVELDRGLAVPVVQAAQDLALRGLARRLTEVADRARAQQLSVDDLMNGTFTVMRSPSADVIFSIPVIVEPQVAILSVDSVVRRPVVVVSEDGGESVAIRSIGVVGLSFDARAIDASRAAGFLARIATLLSTQDWLAQL